MNKKNLIILCVIFILLIGLLFVKKSIKPEIPTTEEIADIIAPAVNIDGLSEIVLRLGDGSGEDEDKPRNVRLSKEEDRWVVESQYGVYANDKTITPLLDKLDQLKGELRSNKKGLFSDYGIGDAEGVHVELRREGAEAIHLIVGTQKAGYQNNFVRLAGTNAVYVVSENLLGALGVRGEDENQKLDVEKWVDKRIAHLKTEEVVGVAITQEAKGSEETVMDIRKKAVDDKKKWQSVRPYPFNLSASKIKSLLDRFNSTYARDVIAPDSEGGFDSPGWTATFTLEDGGQVKLVRGAKDEEEKNYYVKEEGAGYFYLVPVSTFDGREKQQGDIFADNPLEVEESNVDGIEVYDMAVKKRFNAVKKPSTETAEAPAEGDEGDQKPKEESVWQNPDGETVEAAKVKDVINKVKAMKVELLPPSVPSLKAELKVNVTKEGEIKEYTISKENTLDNGKECHFLTASGDEQNYCVSKAQVTALKNALP